MSYPWTGAAILKFISVFIFIITLFNLTIGGGAFSFLFFIGSGYYLIAHDLIKSRNAKDAIIEYSGEETKLVKPVYTSLSGGKVYLGLTDHFMVISNKGEMSKINLHNVLDMKTGQSGTGHFNTTVSNWGDTVTATTKEEKVPYIAFLYHDNGIEDTLVLYGDMFAISKLSKKLSKLTTTGVVAEEREEKKRGEANQKALFDEFSSFVKSLIPWINQTSSESPLNSISSIKFDALEGFINEFPQLHALNEAECEVLGKIFNDSYSKGMLIALKTRENRQFNSIQSLSNINAIEPLIYSIIGQHRTTFENHPIVTMDHLVTFINNNIEDGFQSPLEANKIAN